VQDIRIWGRKKKTEVNVQGNGAKRDNAVQKPQKRRWAGQIRLNKEWRKVWRRRLTIEKKQEPNIRNEERYVERVPREKEPTNEGERGE